MKLYEKFNGARPVFSVEVFPPKKTASLESVYGTLREIARLDPDFISVTYGAGGSTAGLTAEIAGKIRQLGIEPLAHLTSINSTREEVAAVLARLRGAGVENVLALRGDRIPDVPPKTDFPHASALMESIGQVGGFAMAAACYPEGHPESATPEADLAALRKKQELGAGFLITQLFFDNAVYFDFVRRARGAGITIPLHPGIMPIVSLKQVERTIALSAASMPAELTKMLSRYEADPESLRAAGIDYAIRQSNELLAAGAPGIHLYAMNQAKGAGEVYTGIHAALGRAAR